MQTSNIQVESCWSKETVQNSPGTHSKRSFAARAAIDSTLVPNSSSSTGGRLSLFATLWDSLKTVLFDVPMTEVLSLNKALAACNVPYPPTLQGWVLPGLKGCGC